MTATITARITTTWTCPWCTVRAYSIKDLRTHQYVAHRQPCGCLGTKHTQACLSGELAKQKELIDYVKPSQSLLDIVDIDARLDCTRCAGWTCNQCGYSRTKVHIELLPTTCTKCGGSDHRAAPTRHRTERALQACKSRRSIKKDES